MMVSKATQNAQACQAPHALEGTDMLGVDLQVQAMFIFYVGNNVN